MNSNSCLQEIKHLLYFSVSVWTQKFSPPLSFPSLFSQCNRCHRRFHGQRACANWPHPFWALISPFRFNLPVSRFAHPLIGLWGVDTNTKHTLRTQRKATGFLPKRRRHTHPHVWTHTRASGPHQAPVGLFHTRTPLGDTSHRGRTE